MMGFMEINKVAVIGTGAVGCLYGAKLLEHLGKGHVQAIAEGKRLERYRADGLYLNGKRIDFTFTDHPDVADLIIVATKNLQLKEAVRAIRAAVGDHTAIMSLLNGTESEEILAKAYGTDKVLYSFAVGLSSMHEGNRIHYDSDGRIVFGEKDNTVTERIKAIENLFSASHIAYEVPKDIHLELWKKFMLNTAFNTLSAITWSGYGDFLNPALQELVRMASDEVIRVANAEGIPLTQAMVEDNLQTIIHLNKNGKTSMFQDITAGRTTENDWFCGTVVKLGKKHLIPTPTCETLFLLMKSCEASRMRALREERESH
jgi:2-dehydropantoate 2-reductase